MLATYRQSLRLFSRDVWLSLSASALMGFIYSGIYALVFNLCLLRLDYGPAFIGLVNTAIPLAMAILPAS